MHTDVTARIRQLSPSVINKIAAGEVIERPASVVKELLENAVDALASRIEVDIEQGGAELIRIVDDGEGIHADDIELAVASHATSKIGDADDLFKVQTLGFRGEALASIAEVSQFRIRSKTREQSLGTEMSVQGGLLKEPQPCGCPDGTQIEVRQLFFNTPVRRKFLKTQSTEFGHIAEQFTRVALANPTLQMTLRHNGKLVHELPAGTNLQDRLEAFYGTDHTARLIPVDAEHDQARLWGFAAHPADNKSSRKGQYLFLNGRYIQDRSLQHALGEAYRGLVMVGRYPVAYLFLEVPPDQVDVNVHPTKSEVRFQQSQSLYRLLLSTLRNRFLGMDLDSKLSVSAERGSGSSGLAARIPARPSSGADSALQQELASWARSELERHSSSPLVADEGAQGEGLPLTNSVPPDQITAPSNTATDSADSSSEGEGQCQEIPQRPVVHVHVPNDKHPAAAASGMRAMQVHDCYLVVETGEGITVIDQHALHERIMYEQLKRRILSKSVEVQRLLMPLTVDLTFREASILLDHVELLEELGILIQDFGGQTVALTGYPTLLARANPESMLRDVVELLETSGKKVQRQDLIDSLLHMMACKAAIKAGQRLTFEEIEALLSQRHLCDDHHHCPHGRPTALNLTRAELDRQFGRLGS